MFSRLKDYYTFELRPRSKNATVTFATGMDFCNKPEFWKYVESLDCVDADHYVLTYEMNIKHRRKLRELECTVIDVDRYADSIQTNNNFFVSRNIAYYQFMFYLYEYGYRRTAITDAKDIIFQNNIFDVALDDDTMIMTSEGVLHKDSHWNLADQIKFHSKVNELGKEHIQPIDLSEKPVINGGIIYGAPYRIFHEISIFATIEKHCIDMDGFTDQAIWNHYIHSGKIACKLSDPKTDNICITGETIKLGLIDYQFENNKFLTTSGEEWYIIHQWDRTKHRENILND